MKSKQKQSKECKKKTLGNHLLPLTTTTPPTTATTLHTHSKLTVQIRFGGLSRGEKETRKKETRHPPPLPCFRNTAACSVGMQSFVSAAGARRAWGEAVVVVAWVMEVFVSVCGADEEPVEVHADDTVDCLKRRIAERCSILDSVEVTGEGGGGDSDDGSRPATPPSPTSPTYRYAWRGADLAAASPSGADARVADIGLEPGERIDVDKVCCTVRCRARDLALPTDSLVFFVCCGPAGVDLVFTAGWSETVGVWWRGASARHAPVARLHVSPHMAASVVCVAPVGAVLAAAEAAAGRGRGACVALLLVSLNLCNQQGEDPGGRFVERVRAFGVFEREKGEEPPAPTRVVVGGGETLPVVEMLQEESEGEGRGAASFAQRYSIVGLRGLGHSESGPPGGHGQNGGLVASSQGRFAVASLPKAGPVAMVWPLEALFASEESCVAPCAVCDFAGFGLDNVLRLAGLDVAVAGEPCLAVVGGGSPTKLRNLRGSATRLPMLLHSVVRPGTGGAGPSRPALSGPGDPGGVSVGALAVSPSGRWCVGGTSDGVLGVWGWTEDEGGQLQLLSVVAASSPRDGFIRGLCFSPCGSYVYCADTGGVCVLSTAAGGEGGDESGVRLERIYRFRGLGSHLTWVAHAPAEKMVYTACPSVDRVCAWV